jgi:hypothetical protein
LGGTVLALLAATSSGCAGEIVEDDPTDTAVVEEPLTCDLEQGSIVLTPMPGNPIGRQAPVSCTVWFGHGQHLTCPGWDAPPSDIAFECDIWDCICAPKDDPEVVANFATLEVVDARGGVPCRYSMALGAP